MGALQTAHMAGLLQDCEITERGSDFSVAPCKPYLLLLFFFLPLVFPSSLHKYLASTYYVQALVLGSMPFKINKAGTSPSQLSGKTDIKQDET